MKDIPKKILDCTHYGILCKSQTWKAHFRDVAMMMHTHMLNPVAFQQDIFSSIRYNTLAGLIDFPLIKLNYNFRHLNQPDQPGDAALWVTKNTASHVYKMIESFPGIHTFPCKMYISMHYLPKNFKLKARLPPFSIDLRAASNARLLLPGKSLRCTVFI